MRVCSYSFFRHDNSAYEHPNAGEARGRFFVNFLRVLVRAHHACFSGFELRIHHDDRVREMPYFKALERMHDAGLLRLVAMGEAKTLCGGMLWRMLPADDDDVEAVVCRDVDSLPMPHDRRAVEEWWKTKKTAHVMHGSESHSGVMGGTFSFRPEWLDLEGDWTWRKWIEHNEARLNYHGADQHLLNNELRHRFEASLLIHKLKNARMCNEGAAEVRTIIAEPTPSDIHPEVAAHGDGFANFVGACYDVEPPYAFYQRLTSNETVGQRGLRQDLFMWPQLQEALLKIQECEK